MPVKTEYLRIGKFTLAYPLSSTDSYTACLVCKSIPVKGMILCDRDVPMFTLTGKDSYVCSQECFVMWLLKLEA